MFSTPLDSGSRSRKRVYSRMKLILTSPVSPLRFLAMSTMASVMSFASFEVAVRDGRLSRNTTSASCSIAPESRRSDSFGFSSLSLRCSFARESCERTMTGTFSSFAMALTCWEIIETSI